MSASVVTCIACLQCGATCGQCASRARSEHNLPNGTSGVCLKARLPACSVRLTRDPRVAGPAPPLAAACRAPQATVRPVPLPLHPSTSSCGGRPTAASAAGPQTSRSAHAAAVRPPVPLHVRHPPPAKDGKRIRDACDFGDPAKLAEVVKRKKDDSAPTVAVTSAAAGSSGEGAAPQPAESRLTDGDSGRGPAAPSSHTHSLSRTMYQSNSQPALFLNSDPSSVLKNVGIPRKPDPSSEPGSGKVKPVQKSPLKQAPAEKPEKTETGERTSAGSDSDIGSDEDAYSDISDVSEPDNAEDAKANAYADGDDSASDFEDNHSVMSGMTAGSGCSLTPSLVGETLGGISLTEPPPPLPSGHTIPALHLSLFPHVPPSINFCQYNEKTEELPAHVRRLLRWRLSTITPQLVRQTITNSGLRLTKKTPNWIGTWGKHMKSECFKAVRDFQKVNHFPGTFQIGRKDKLWKNISALQLKFGKNDFGFVPRTYILPTDLKELKLAWRRDGGKRKWIIKPPASARGTGIKVIQRWSQLPKKKQLIVQRYVSRPYLIEDRKFDLRIYVYVTSFSPLRVYIHEDGLVRFASVKYSNVGKTLSDRFMHLTNYSINKNSEAYQPNDDAELCQGHKWTLKVFWTYMKERGIDTEALWRRIIDMVVKTVVSGEHHILQLIRHNVVSNYCCHELFGFDVLLDEKLRPWLLEVNISPSLHSAASVDMSVKGPLVRDLFNLSGLHVPNKLSAEQQTEVIQSLPSGETVQRLVLDKRLYTSVCTPDERVKQTECLKLDRAQYLTKILENLTPDDVRHLIRTEDELTRRGGFVRIFPTVSTHHYHQYFEKPRYYNRLLDAWEVRYARDREAGRARLRVLCQDKYHLVVPGNYLRRRTFNAETVAAAEAVRRAQLMTQAGITTPAASRPVKSTALAALRTVSSDSGLSSMETEARPDRPRPRAARPPSVTTRPAYKSLPALRRARQSRLPAAAAARPEPSPASVAAAAPPPPARLQVVNEVAPPAAAARPGGALHVQGYQISPAIRPASDA